VFAKTVTSTLNVDRSTVIQGLMNALFLGTGFKNGQKAIVNLHSILQLLAPANGNAALKTPLEIHPTALQ